MAKVSPSSRNRQLTKKEKQDLIPYPKDSPRPSEMTEDDCCYPDAPRPCPLVSCRYNNYLSPTDNGTILLSWPDKQPEDVPPEDSCALDVSRRGQTSDRPMLLKDLGVVVGQRSRQAMDLEVKRAQKSFKQAWRSKLD